MGCCSSMCRIEPTCLTQDEMTKNHSTPAVFREACARALGEISLDEYHEAVTLYEKAWCKAGRDEAAVHGQAP